MLDKLSLNLDIPGWISERNMNIIGNLASLVPENGSIMELGSFCGRSTSALYMNKKSGVSLAVVDPWGFSKLFNVNIIMDTNIDGSRDMLMKAYAAAEAENDWRGGFEYCLGKDVYDQIEVNHTTSHAFNKTKDYDLVFIDASHTYTDVTNEIDKFITPDNMLFGDDFNDDYRGVMTAVADARKKHGRTLIVFEDSRLWLLIPNRGYWRDLFNEVNVFSLVQNGQEKS